jgi:hypothetical protein
MAQRAAILDRAKLIVLVLLVLCAPARATDAIVSSVETPTVDSTRAVIFDLIEACRHGGEGEERTLPTNWSFQCPLCSLLRSDDWEARRGVRPDLVLVERALRRPHSDLHGLAGLVERHLRAGSPLKLQSGLIERFDLCWLELGILLDAAAAVR